MAEIQSSQQLSEKIMALAKRRGILWPSYEIYGGVAGFYDYAPIGARMRRNIEDAWRRFYVVGEGFAEIDCPTISPEEVFKASGHLDKFSDLMVECTACHEYGRADHVAKVAKENVLAKAAKNKQHKDAPQELIGKLDGVIDCRLSSEEVDTVFFDCGVKCQKCGGALGKSQPFNLMFRTNVGPGGKKIGYLRPETAQAMFMDYNLLFRYFREKLPFGAVQLGRGYRNEIAPRQGIIRLREFNMAEAEIFFDPKNKTVPRFSDVARDGIFLVPNEGAEKTTTIGEAAKDKTIANEALAYYVAITQRFLLDVGVRKDKLRFRQHLKTEMAHYAADCWDAEALTGFGWVEIVGIADRTSFDLEAHSRVSGVELKAPDDSPAKEVETLSPKLGALGPKFKKDSGTIKGALDALGQKSEFVLAAKRDTEARLNIKDGAPRAGHHSDGANYTVPQDCYEISLVKVQSKFTPHVIEPSYGIDRIFYTVLEHSYFEDKKEGEPYTVLRVPPHISAIKAGVFPLMAKDGLDEIARGIDRTLREGGLTTYYDDTGSIGKRYARMDEVGTPYCITVDYDTKKDNTATIRDRDKTDQIRVKIDALHATLSKLLLGQKKI